MATHEIKRREKDISLKGYQPRFNDYPHERMEEISESAFAQFLIYEVWDFVEMKQPRVNGSFKGTFKVFIKEYKGEALGIAVSNAKVPEYYKFGDWDGLLDARVKLFSGDGKW